MAATTTTATNASADRRWQLPEVNEACAESLAHHLGCPLPMARILAKRGIATAADAEAFFNPALDSLHDPMLLLGMPAALARIEAAVDAQQPILIYGDYDVDGTTATVLLKTAIERIAPPERPAQVTYHVPHRLREGYGMQTNVLGLASTSGIRLVISVDTGIRAFAAAVEAKALGLDLIVTDHHLPDEAAGIPDAHAVINPAQPGCPYPNKHLCGAAVAFKLAQALMEAHAARATDPAVARHRLRTAILPSFLKLVAIATIADSVALTGENRTIVALGLSALRNPVQLGLRALMDVAQLPLDRAPTAAEVGFRLAPRINAAGRMDIAADVVELFLTRDPGRATALAAKLDRLNQDRRAAEAEALSAIELKLAALRPPSEAFPADCIILDDATWHRGVLGILASRVVDRTGRPALILTHQEGSAHGSGRSIPGFHLLDALTAVHQHGQSAPLFSRFGGHAHAVGLTLPSESLRLLRARMTSHAALHLTSAVLTPSLPCDAAITLAEVTVSLQTWLERLAPFGHGAPEPIFAAFDVSLAAPIRIVKERHLCLQLRDTASPGASPREAMAWSRAFDWVQRGSDLALQPGSRIDVAFKLCTSVYQGNSRLQLELVDLRPMQAHARTDPFESSSCKYAASFPQDAASDTKKTRAHAND